jgi:hypothetical protein
MEKEHSVWRRIQAKVDRTPNPINEQPGSYEFVRRISTDKRASLQRLIS